MVHYEENIKERQWLSEDNGSKTSQISWKINKEVS
jgi:outer membrane protease